MLLKGKTAVVYGAAGAVGSAVARLFAREGATVVLAGRSSTPLAVLAANIERAGGTASDLPVDALDGDAMDQHADAIVEQTGRLDVSLNAIAVDHLQGVPLTELPEQDVVGQVVDRVRTHLLTARAAARHMTTQGRGVILTFTADAARLADPNIGGFGVACAAVEGLTRALAAELGPDGVRVVCLRSMGSPEAPGVDDVWKKHFAGATAAGTTDDVLATRAAEAAGPRGDACRGRQRRRPDGLRSASPLTAAVVNVRLRGNRRLTVSSKQQRASWLHG
jgi:NAD(P)-dependent dehydrogenase (short-subunit alcohol dehydrogenase family)